jgi:hypothetical protein
MNTPIFCRMLSPLFKQKPARLSRVSFYRFAAYWIASNNSSKLHGCPAIPAAIAGVPFSDP